MNIREMFTDSFISDYKMNKVEIDYEKESILLYLFSPQSEEIKVEIFDFMELNFSNLKKWGMGTYIVSSDYSIDGDEELYELQFNSGDKLVIKCKKG